MAFGNTEAELFQARKPKHPVIEGIACAWAFLSFWLGFFFWGVEVSGIPASLIVWLSTVIAFIIFGILTRED